MRAAIRRWNSIAVRLDEAVGIYRPPHRPFGRAVATGLAGAPGKNVRMHQGRALDALGEIVAQPFGEMEGRVLRYVLDVFQQRFGAVPADFDPAEQIRLRARHLEHALGLESRVAAENLRI